VDLKKTNMRICNKCKKNKELKDFSQSTRTEDKINRICKQCVSDKETKRRKEREFYKQFEII
jgi:superfamily II helicase